MRVTVVLNPRANRGRAAMMREKIVAWGERYGGLDLVVTAGSGHARMLAAEAVSAGVDVVVAAGGDGTVNEVVNGLLAPGRGTSPRPNPAGPALGIIPIGSGNDYSHGLGFPAGPKAAVDRLFTGTPRPVDAARIEDDHGRVRIVCNGVGIGFDAAAAIESLNITALYGFPRYALAALRALLFHYQAPRYRMAFDGERVSQRTLLLAVGVGSRVGGGFRMTPDARFDDGLVDSCLVDPVGRLTILTLLFRVLRGAHVRSRHVTMKRSRCVSVTAGRALPIHVDGEIFAFLEDDVRQVTITSLPEALRVVM